MAVTYSKCKDQPGKVANTVRGQLNGENVFSPVPVKYLARQGRVVRFCAI